MFYSQRFQSPISLTNVKRLFGINPVNEPARALAAGIYPLTETPTGYSASHFEEENNDTYTAVPNCVSINEMAMVNVLRSIDYSLEELRESLGLKA